MGMNMVEHAADQPHVGAFALGPHGADRLRIERVARSLATFLVRMRPPPEIRDELDLRTVSGGRAWRSSKCAKRGGGQLERSSRYRSPRLPTFGGRTTGTFRRRNLRSIPSILQSTGVTNPLPSKCAFRFSTTSLPIACRVSKVKLPMCGVSITFSSFRNSSGT